MSFDAIRWAMAQEPSTMTARWVLARIADCVNVEDRDRCFPSQIFLAERVGCSIRTLGESLRVLEAEGFITRERRGSSSDVIVLSMGRQPAISADKQHLPEQPAKSAGRKTKNQKPIQVSPPIVPPSDGNNLPAPVLALVVNNADARTPEREAFDLWNEMATRLSLPVAEKFTEERETKLKARLKEGGLKRWKEALLRVECSSFCRGARDWFATLDFLLQKSSYQKVLDNNYRADLQPGQSYDPRTSPDRRQAEASDRLRSLHQAAMGGGTEEF